MNVGQLRAAMEGLPDDVTVCIAAEDGDWKHVDEATNPRDKPGEFIFFTLWPSEAYVDGREPGWYGYELEVGDRVSDADNPARGGLILGIHAGWTWVKWNDSHVPTVHPLDDLRPLEEAP